MDRVIKFRVWCPRLKEIMFVGALDWFSEKDRSPQTCNTKEHKLYTLEGEERFVLMQYTGLNDSKGNEIYEGHIVKFGDYEGTIQFNIGSFIIQCEDEITSDVYFYGLGDIYIKMNDGIRVVGNIYESEGENGRTKQTTM